MVPRNQLPKQTHTTLAGSYTTGIGNTDKFQAHGLTRRQSQSSSQKLCACRIISLKLKPTKLLAWRIISRMVRPRNLLAWRIISRMVRPRNLIWRITSLKVKPSKLLFVRGGGRAPLPRCGRGALFLDLFVEASERLVRIAPFIETKFYHFLLPEVFNSTKE
jgi:hypothetical protein